MGNTQNVTACVILQQPLDEQTIPLGDLHVIMDPWSILPASLCVNSC